MEIPKRFKIANQWYDVEVKDEVYMDGEGVFGTHSATRAKIEIARQIKYSNGDIVAFKDEQILNTFWHELFHAFTYYWNNDIDEALAQTFANFMREYESTKE